METCNANQEVLMVTMASFLFKIYDGAVIIFPLCNLGILHTIISQCAVYKLIFFHCKNAKKCAKSTLSLVMSQLRS